MTCSRWLHLVRAPRSDAFSSTRWIRMNSAEGLLHELVTGWRARCHLSVNHCCCSGSREPSGAVVNFLKGSGTTTRARSSLMLLGSRAGVNRVALLSWCC